MSGQGCGVDAKFENVDVGGALAVVGSLNVNGQSVFSVPTINTTAVNTAFTAANNTTHLLDDTGANTRVIAIPAPTQGAVIKFILTADLNDGGQWTIGTTADDVDFAIGSKLVSASTGGAAHQGAVAVDAHGFNVLNIAGDTNGGGGVGSTVTLTGVVEGANETNRWLVDAFICVQGNGTVADASTFA